MSDFCAGGSTPDDFTSHDILGLFHQYGYPSTFLTQYPSTFADTHLMFSGCFINTNFLIPVPGLDQIPLAREIKTKKTQTQSRCTWTGSSTSRLWNTPSKRTASMNSRGCNFFLYSTASMNSRGCNLSHKVPFVLLTWFTLLKSHLLFTHLTYFAHFQYFAYFSFFYFFSCTFLTFLYFT